MPAYYEVVLHTDNKDVAKAAELVVGRFTELLDQFGAPTWDDNDGWMEHALGLKDPEDCDTIEEATKMSIETAASLIGFAALTSTPKPDPKQEIMTGLDLLRSLSDRIAVYGPEDEDEDDEEDDGDEDYDEEDDERDPDADEDERRLNQPRD